MFTTVMIILLIQGCAGLLTVEVMGVKSDGCVWVDPLYLSEPSIKALRDAQVDHPEVRSDREQIVIHNKLYELNCPPDPTE